VVDLTTDDGYCMMIERGNELRLMVERLMDGEMDEACDV
jgi:hypothetical protein